MAASPEAIQSLRSWLAGHHQEMIDFLREIVAIPSYESKIGPVGEAIAAGMKKLGFHDVKFDAMGNVLGRVGAGKRILIYDSHIDTVGIGDPSAWKWDPLQGKVENGILYARGAGDEKGSTPPMIYAMAALQELGLLGDWSIYYFGNMEEWCDGIAPHALVEHEGLRPDYVVIGESTGMQIYRGHRGRIEVSAKFNGRSCHASAPERGDNPVYKALPFIDGVKNLHGHLPADPFLGKGSLTVTSITCETPSLNAVPDSVEVYLDRRVTTHDTKDSVLAELRALPNADQAIIEVPMYEEPSYTGFVFPVEKVFPAWALPEDHPLVSSAVEAFRAIWGKEPGVSKWVFSTNGTYWMGKAGIPSIGFGPGYEEVAHTVDDQVPIGEVLDSAEFYACLPLFL